MLLVLAAIARTGSKKVIATIAIPDWTRLSGENGCFSLACLACDNTEPILMIASVQSDRRSREMTVRKAWALADPMFDVRTNLLQYIWLCRSLPKRLNRRTFSVSPMIFSRSFAGQRRRADG